MSFGGNELDRLAWLRRVGPDGTSYPGQGWGGANDLCGAAIAVHITHPSNPSPMYVCAYPCPDEVITPGVPWRQDSVGGTNSSGSRKAVKTVQVNAWREYFTSTKGRHNNRTGEMGWEEARSREWINLPRQLRGSCQPPQCPLPALLLARVGYRTTQVGDL